MENKNEEKITRAISESETIGEVLVNNSYKDNIFRMLFRNKKELLSLYNAFNGTNYDNYEDIEINTLENSLYLGYRNDVSFIFKFFLNLYEHQSTPNPNMPLRNLIYESKLYKIGISKDDIYGSKLVRINTPRFIVLYNGSKTQEETFEYKLSDSFINKTDNPSLELKVMVYNINKGMNENLKNACKTLKEYMIFVNKVRDYTNGRKLSKEELTQIINKTVDECIKENVLKEFMIMNREAVMNTCLFEYDEEKHIKNEKNISFEEGIAQEKHDSVLRMLEKNVPLENIADYLDVSIDYIKQIEAELLAKA